MRVTDVRDMITTETGSYFIEHKISSLIHRIKNKENPNEELLKGLLKFLIIEDKLKEKIMELDFSNLKKGKMGRGKDKKERRKEGTTKKSKGYTDFHSYPCVDEYDTYNY